MSKCLGCGITLQNENPNMPGYTKEDFRYCERCFKVKNYNAYEKSPKNNLDYLTIINSIPKDASVIYISSILTLNLSLLNKFNNPLLVITKKDIMPKSINEGKIIESIKKDYHNIDVIMISSLKNYHLDELYSKLLKQNKKEIYIIGNTNSGKSTLINKIIKNYSDSNIEITTSFYPETTLDKIIIPLKDFTLIDTPGLVEKDSIINYVDEKMLKKINVKKEIKPKTYQIKGKGSLIIEDLIRIDYETKENSLVMYLSNLLNVIRVTTSSKLKDKHKLEFNLDNNKDIVIEDLGFIKFVNSIKLTIYTKDNIKIYQRDNLI